MLYKKQQTKNISFPLGGIGTGCIGLGGNGELIDWEIFNRPNKNTRNGYSHFAIKAKYDGKTITKVLHGDTTENLSGTASNFGLGARSNSMAGFPHFKNLVFKGNFPIAKLSYTDDDFPAKIKLCSFNPLIPHDEYNSSLPAAFFEWEIENTTNETVEYAIAFSVQNPSAKSSNRTVKNEKYKAVFFGCEDKTSDEIGYSDLTVITDAADSVSQANWYRGTWMDSVTTFWNNFYALDRLQEREYDKSNEKNDHGTLAAYVTIKPGQKEKIRFVLSWNVPVQYNYWNPLKDEQDKDVTWKNYYATLFKTSLQTAEYALENYAELYKQTEKFTRALTESTLPPFITDAISANLSVIKSPTVFRLEDGSLWGWEGCYEKKGSCEGSCQHVWNYAYVVPFLFPNLEKSLRENTFKYALLPNGKTTFRIPLPAGRQLGKFRACVDGQMGEIIKCYREWKISGDTEWIKSRAESIFKMIEYAWSEENEDKWDANGDGILEGRQHHTLDVELFGENSWLQGFYSLALDCASKIAEAVGDERRVTKYRHLCEQGKKHANKFLFNGEYFTQKIDLTDKSVLERFGAENYYWSDETNEIKYQIGEGCIIDQVLSDWHAAILGLNGVFEVEKKQKALKSIYKYNFKPSMRTVTNMWRNFALNDESGTIICAYPDYVKKPEIPIPYCEETMTGFEYAFGGLLIAQGFVKEGESVIRAIRNRYDGKNRNPWNEIECGSNYVRSMASFALLPIYSGFIFDMTKKEIGFRPVSKSDGKYLWSVGNSWGTIRFSEKVRTLRVSGKPFTLSRFVLQNGEKAYSVQIDGKQIKFRQDDEVLVFDSTPISSHLRIRLR